jgi:hypothetical protein
VPSVRSKLVLSVRCQVSGIRRSCHRPHAARRSFARVLVRAGESGPSEGEAEAVAARSPLRVPEEKQRRASTESGLRCECGS